MTTLSAVLIIVAYNMSGWREFIAMRKSPKSDYAVLLITFVLTVCFDLVVAIEVGMVAAALLFMSRMANTSDVRKWKDYEESYDENSDPDAIRFIKLPKKTQVYEITGPLFFGAADKLINIYSSLKKENAILILRMRGVPALDATACKELKNIYSRCQAYGTTLIISHINDQPLSVLKKDGLYDMIGEENFLPNIHSAIDRAQAIAKN